MKLFNGKSWSGAGSSQKMVNVFKAKARRRIRVIAKFSKLFGKK